MGADAACSTLQHLAAHLSAWQLKVVEALSNAHARPYMVPFAFILVISGLVE